MVLIGDWIDINEKRPENMDDIVLLSIIECCKQLAINGVPLYEWDADSVLDVFDEVIEC